MQHVCYIYSICVSLRARIYVYIYVLLNAFHGLIEKDEFSRDF